MAVASVAKKIPEMSAPPTQPRPPARVKLRGPVPEEIVAVGLKLAFVMLRPDIQWANPVMFVVEVGAVLTLLFVIQAAFGASESQVPITYFIALDIWLWLP